MSRNLYSTVGQSSVDNLILDNLERQVRQEVILPAGEYQRGQLLVIAANGSDASLPLAATTVIDCVLLDEIGTIAEPTPAAVSRTGEFNQNVVLWGAIPEANREAVIEATKKLRPGLWIRPAHQAPFVQFGEV